MSKVLAKTIDFLHLKMLTFIRRIIMKSIKDLYKIGKGPSSSHTMGPEKASKIFLSENPTADSFRAVLYGSLAKSGFF